MRDIYKIHTNPAAPKEAVVQGDSYRISVLTPWLLRMEYSQSGEFEDRSTQCVLNRDFPVPRFQIFEKEDSLTILTEGLIFQYDKKPFSPNGLSIQVRGTRSAWNYGDEPEDLRGTARTLDEADGAIPLEHGLISRKGFALMDDSGSLLIREDGWVEPRQGSCQDLYFFGYGHQYEKCLEDFYHLTGHTPLLPRFVLGNWWSRFHKYTQEEYQDLVCRFEKEEIPFSVAVIDMDWHLTQIDPRYGSGWTGYTWNRELFPDPGSFMNWLHEHQMKVTLNVHPAEGVGPHEDAYRTMAEALGKNWKEEEIIEFDITDPKFLDAYFAYLHHPNEEAGVDFWWIDWQQGSRTKIPGLDPLWMLNHYHYLDSKRKGERGLTFSRYAGLGSHRYPVGFSGDTVITWESLAFQPYFTANASNAGYGWWSHDIGGHMKGYRDEELTVRWVQYGVFSPIMRLHSTDNPFISKEPWNFGETAQRIMKRFLRMRHELIPYLYSMNYQSRFQGRPLIRPMYYAEPEREEAYQVPNEYYFGTEMIACPITVPLDKKAKTAPVKAWIPEGMWFDFFNGRIYQGGRMMYLHRELEDFPVLVKAGGIIPMADFEEFTNSTENPDRLAVRIFPGAGGCFHLYEDAGREEDSCGDTVMNWDYQQGIFTISPEGCLDSLPAKRSFRLEFWDIRPAEAEVYIDGKRAEAESSYDGERQILTVSIVSADKASRIEVRFKEKPELGTNDLKGQCYRILYNAEMEYGKKLQIFQYLQEGKLPVILCGILETMELEEEILGALKEVLTA